MASLHSVIFYLFRFPLTSLLCPLLRFLLYPLLFLGLLAHSGQTLAAVNFEVPFQENLQNKPVSSLNIELGGYDVSSFAQLSDQNASVSLDTVLTPGQYPVVILVFYQDGEVQTLADTTITIQATAGQNWSANATLSTSYRTDEKNAVDFTEYKHWHSNGGFQAEHQYQSGSWETTAKLESLYDSNSQNHADDNEWQLATYQAGIKHKGDNAYLGLYAGQTNIEQNNLLFGHYQRRGLSLHAGNNDNSIHGAVFGTISDISTSHDENLLQPEDSNEETVGATFSISPLPFAKEQLIVGLGYVNGRGTSAGSGFTSLDEDSVYGGDSWNATIDSFWLSRSLWLHLDYAESSFDSDGLNTGDDEIDDDAYKVMLQLSSQGDLPAMGLDYWNLSLEHQQVGTYFYSIANLALAGDIEINRASFSGGKGSISFNLEVNEQQNNVNNEANRATMSTDYRGLDIYYNPVMDTNRGFWAVMGMPSLNAYYHENDNYQQDNDAQITGFDLDKTTDEVSLGLQFSHLRWSWGISHTLTNSDDRSDTVLQNGIQVYTPGSDTENTLTVLQLSWFPNQRVSISPLLQWTHLQETDFSNEYKTFNAGFDSQFQLVPERLFLNLNYSLNDNNNRFADPTFIDTDFKHQTGNVQMLWKAVMARALNPGVDLYLNGSYGKQEDETNHSVIENWQIKLGFNVYWSGSN